MAILSMIATLFRSFVITRKWRPASVRVGLLLVLLSSLSACAANRQFVWVQQLKAPELTADQLSSGDVVYVTVSQQTPLSGRYEVNVDGSIVLPIVGRVEIAGLTREQAIQRIQQSLQRVVVSPRVSLAIVSRHPTFVAVIGEVKTPGRFKLDPGEGILSALARAGGLTEFADSDSIYVLRHGSPLERIRFRYDDLTGGDRASNRFVLRDGDTVVVR